MTYRWGIQISRGSGVNDLYCGRVGCLDVVVEHAEPAVTARVGRRERWRLRVLERIRRGFGGETESALGDILDLLFVRSGWAPVGYAHIAEGEGIFGTSSFDEPEWQSVSTVRIMQYIE